MSGVDEAVRIFDRLLNRVLRRCPKASDGQHKWSRDPKTGEASFCFRCGERPENCS